MGSSTNSNYENERLHTEFLSKFNKTETSNKRKVNDDGWVGVGGYMKAKNQKLQQQFDAANSNKISDIFNGVSIWITGYTNPSSDKLKKLIGEHGGRYQHFFSKTNVTHIIATNLPDGKIKNLKSNDKVVHPSWIIDSVKGGKLLAVKKYLLYSMAKRDCAKINFQQKIQIPYERDIYDECTTTTGNYTEKNMPADKVEVENSYLSESDDLEDNLCKIQDHNIDSSEIPRLSKHTYCKSKESKSTLKAGDENYIKEFYANSRLHHLSMWKAELKKFAVLIQEKWKNRDVAQKTNRKAEKIIMHIDMDSFFVSVALKVHPELKGKPIAVCHSGINISSDKDYSNSWSEIASCSYEARDYGIHNGMLLKDAKVLCPELICVPYYFVKYSEISQKFYGIISRFTCEIEAVSCDEALLDISDFVNPGDDVLDIAEHIRQEIFTTTQCTASCGIGNSILIARLATRQAKPDGKCYIPREEVNDFISIQQVKDLPGVGYSWGKKLDALGINTCSDLQKLLLSVLQREFGNKFGEKLYKFARGIDDRKVKLDHERKSVSAVINYGMRFTHHLEVENFIKDLSLEIEKRLKDNNKKGKHITVKLMVRQKDASTTPDKYMGCGICDTLSKSYSLPSPTNNPTIIGETCVRILRSLKVPAEDYRGLGIQITKLSDSFGDSASMSSLTQFTKPITAAELFKRDQYNRLDGSSKNKLNTSPVKKTLTIDKYISTGSATFRKNDQIDCIPSKLPPLPSLNINSLVSSPSNHRRADKSVSKVNNPDDDIQGLSADWDPKVLAELPDYIRKELLSEQNIVSAATENSSLVRINVGNSPSHHNKRMKDCQRSPIVKKITLKKGRGQPKTLKGRFDRTKYRNIQTIDKHVGFAFRKETHLVSSVTDYHISNLEIDLQVVNELPESMKNEILVELQRPSHVTIQNNRLSNEKDVIHSKCRDLYLENSKSNQQENHASVNQMLLSPSQMDQSVLQALPKDIRDDVINDANKRKQNRLYSKNNAQYERNITNKNSINQSARYVLDNGEQCKRNIFDCSHGATAANNKTLRSDSIISISVNPNASCPVICSEKSSSLLTSEKITNESLDSLLKICCTDSEVVKNKVVPLTDLPAISLDTITTTTTTTESSIEIVPSMVSRSKTKDTSHILLSPSQIDTNVLEALPLSIQREVIIAAKSEKQKRIRLKEKQLQQQQQKVHIDTINQEEESSSKVVKVKQNMPIFHGVSNYNDVKNMLRNWVNNYSEPLPQDVEEIIKYFNELLEMYNMESLFSFVLFLRRIVSSCSLWYTAFNKILHSVQIKMKSLYSGAFPVSSFPV